ncbi:maleylpyruvate isomerase family mycothiol-dependent enzyme [Streptomyces sp. NPDC048566]|uniref:maleylpyruvate isomerase family mycothiol-dependent enzyme n=1 Tax=Streptomyces sp. NPDC048566 TaxID=3365569 RepID=UPI00371241B9
MKIEHYVQTLDREGGLLLAAAEAAGTDAPVATCPGWLIGDLVRHTGAIHRWATAFVAERLPSYRPDAGLPDLDGDALLSWFREGHAVLVETLAGAPRDLACWSFLPAPSGVAFWARRQAHETAVHRMDAVSALGGEPDPVSPEFAVDGIDELLQGFHARPQSRVRTEEPRVLRVAATDVPGAVWTVRLSADAPVSRRTDPAADAPAADCELSGPAPALYRALWNRAPFPNVAGDAALATLWQETSRIT